MSGCRSRDRRYSKSRRARSGTGHESSGQTGVGSVWLPLGTLNMLTETEGRNFTPAEYSAWLEEAGFRHVETVWFHAPAANGAVIGRRP